MGNVHVQGMPRLYSLMSLFRPKWGKGAYLAAHALAIKPLLLF